MSCLKFLIIKLNGFGGIIRHISQNQAVRPLANVPHAISGYVDVYNIDQSAFFKAGLRLSSCVDVNVRPGGLTFKPILGGESAKRLSDFGR